MAGTTSADITKTLASAKKSRTRPILIWTGVVLVAVLGGWLWLSRAQTSGGITYTTEAITRGDLTVTVTATGTVQPTTEVEVSSELSGTLASVEVDYNDEVAVGQVLARLDDTKLKAQVANATASLAAAKAQVAQAEATTREAAAIFETQEVLDRRGVVNHTDFITTTANNERAKAALDAAKADLTLAEANLELQQADLDKSVIRSPIKGVVLDRAYSAGQIVAASLSAPTLFTLAEDLTRMELQVDIDEADIGQVAVGNVASFTVDAYSGQQFPATITQVRYAPEETDDVVTYKAVLTVNNDAKLLRPGMTATAAITVSRVSDALQVPNAALRYAPPQVAQDSGSGAGGLVGLIMPSRSDQNSAAKASAKTVWVLRDGVPTEIEVTPGPSDGKHTVIEAGDVTAGDLVITDQREAQ